MAEFNTSVPAPSQGGFSIRPPDVQSPLEVLSQLQEMRQRNLQTRALEQENQQRQFELEDAKTMRGMLPGLMQDPSYQTGGMPDWEKIIPALAQHVSPKTAFSLQSVMLGNQEKRANIQKALADTNLNTEKVAEAERDYFGGLGLQIQKQNYSPAAIEAMFHQAEALHPSYGQHVAQLRQMVAADPNGGKAVIDGLVSSSMAATKEQREQDLATSTIAKNKQETKNAELAAPGIEAKSKIEKASADALSAMTPADWQNALDAVVPDKDSPLYKRTLAEMQLARSHGDLKAAQDAIKQAGEQLGRTETAVATAKATVPYKIEVQQGAANQVSGAGLDLMATQVLNGQPFNSRNPMLTAKVYGRAAEMAKEMGLSDQEVLMKQAAAKANRGALDSLTKQYETLKPFEEMAIKNAKVLEEQVAKVASLGAPFLNTPLRNLQQRFLGNTDVAALVAALQPVQADFARILNSPTGGGVLSDDARHDMQQAISPGATYGQIKAALDIFRRDAANRHATYDAAVRDLTGRTTVTGPGAPQENASQPAGPKKELKDIFKR